MTDTSTTPTPPPIGSTVLGYPRIERRRELKRAVEAHWAGTLDADGLQAAAREVRQAAWRRLADLGLGSIPSNTSSHYDHVLDTALLLGAVPDRYRAAAGEDPLALEFAMARGAEGVAPLELTKWFDTNYHYLVPEIGPDTPIALTGDKPLAEHREAKGLGIDSRPVLLGPVSFLLLAKAAEGAPGGFRPLDRLGDVVAAYAELLGRLADAGADWVQFDEPAFVADRADAELAAHASAYQRLGGLDRRPALLVASYFGDLGPALPILADTPVEGLAVDLVAGSGAETLATVPQLRGKVLVAGVVDGRNVWRTDLRAALGTAATLLGVCREVAVSTSCSLLHVPHDADDEPDLDPRLRTWLAFADQKVDEVVTLARGLRDGAAAVAEALDQATAALADRAGAPGIRDGQARGRLAELGADAERRAPYDERVNAQAERLALRRCPPTTIGSFPQTDAIRRLRAEHRAGRLDDAGYEAGMREEIESVVRLQERLGLDVIVHGEPERNDMVQYFAEQLDGYAATTNGWVQSYGSRCVRPPILFGDVHRPEPMTVEYSRYAQSLTDKPVKGMLTGPVTMLAWSFVRDDQRLAETARQVALAIRDEVGDLEEAGVAIVQVDEPALRELLPLRAVDQPAYLDWAVRAFRLATGGAAPTTQVHTHLCYSEFNEVVDAIADLDADVTSIEAARSRMEVLPALAATGFARGIGPGVYDIHSPRVPGREEIGDLLAAALEAVPADRLWVNPDCGLKTRGYAEVEPALAGMVAAAERLRAS